MTVSGQHQPFTALPNWIRGEATAEEIGLLWLIQSYAPNARPSISTLVVQSGLSRSKVYQMLNLFEERGWLQRMKRFTSNGSQTANRYNLSIWENRSKPVSHVHQVDPPPSTTWTPPVHQVDTPRPSGGPEQEPMNKNQLKKKENPHSPQTIIFPTWLHPYKEDLKQWLRNRKKAHPKLKPEFTKSTIKALLYARDLGVLEEYCAYASERNWQSLGFIGFKDLIDKLAKESGKQVKATAASSVRYTLQ